ncbi:MAG: Crp/Fnr family transcriptional regulator [Bacteroidota bacterium]
MSLQPFFDHLNQFLELNKQELGFLKEAVHFREFSKGSVLLESGKLSQAFYFNLKGCVRLYYEVDGEEKTAFFYTENQFISSYESFTRQLPSRHSLQCIEDCQLVEIGMEAAANLLAYSPKFEALARIMMEEELIIYQDIISSFITLKPEERYLKLSEESPALFQRIPQYHLASYLGITPESLSRIKKRRMEKDFLNKSQGDK